MQWPGRITLLMLLMLTAPAHAAREPARVTVAEPFIEMRTGPGRGYPVFHVADRGEAIAVIRRRTDWYEVRTDREVKGWVHARELRLTLAADGQLVGLPQPGWDDFADRRWEASVSFGDFDGASSITLAGAYRFTANISAELAVAHITGDFSDGWLAAARLIHTPFPEWRVAPYALLGTGVLHVSPRASLVSTEDRTDQMAQAGIGVRAWVSERFLLRAEYAGYTVFTSRDENEEVEEWKAGIAFFF